MRKLFAERHHYWHFSVSIGGQLDELIAGYGDKLMTSARLALLMREKGYPDNAVIVAFSYMGKMTEAQVKGLV